MQPPRPPHGHSRRLFLVVLTFVGLWSCVAATTEAQTIQPPFDAHYTLTDLGSVPGLPTSYGGLVVDRDDPDTLLIGGAANGATGKLYAIALVRDVAGHVTGFSGTATEVADAANNDGGIIYGPDGVLFLARYPLNQLGQTKPGSTLTDKIIDLAPLGVSGSPGGLAYVPEGFPGAGQLKICGYPDNVWHDLTFAPDGSGTFAVTAATNVVTLSGGVEGIAYVPPGSPEFADHDAVLISEYSAGKVSTYELDANGNPEAPSRRELLTGLTGAEGATIDPVTGDFLFSTFGGTNRVIAIRGFVAPGATPTPTPTATPAVCGNGVVDAAAGEQCDIAIAGSACCTAGCQIADATTVCRHADGVCDVAESCDGTSPTCPADVRRQRARAGAPRADTTEAGTGHLGSAALQKAAVKCGQVVAKARAKVVSGKFKALDACANAALACVQTKAEQPDCVTKAGQQCAKKLSAATIAAEKTQAKIATAKSCAVDLRLPDLLAADGLGFGEIADRCRTDFGLDVCNGVVPLAQCLVQTQDRAVGRLYGAARPRTAEVLQLLPVVLPTVAGLETFAGCGNCSSTGDRKAVEQCGKALTAATRALVAALDARLGDCAARVFECTQAKADKPECLVKAKSKCEQATTKVTTSLAKFADQAAKKCGPDAADFAQLAATSGLDLAALAPECAAFGLAAPSSTATLADCLQRRVRCTAAELVQQSNARTDAFAADGRFGSLTSELASVCPESDLGAKQRHARTIFGSMGKFMRSIRRSGVVSIKKPGTPPGPTANAGKRVATFGGSQRVTAGTVTKLPFTYRVTPRARAAAGARAAAPPTLIVAVLADAATSEDYFEVPLDPPTGQAEVSDEIELAYQDTLPGCVFTLTFAIADGGVVSDYTDLPVVVDPELDPCE